MKRILQGMLLAVLLAGCSFYFTDQDGFRIADNRDLPEGCYVVQSHEWFRVGDRLYKEKMREDPFTIENVLPRQIEVRIWHEGKTQWVTIPALGSLTLGETR